MREIINQLCINGSNDIYTLVFLLIAFFFAFVWRDLLITFFHKTYEIIFSNDWRTFYVQGAKSGDLLSVILTIVNFSALSIFVHKIFPYYFEKNIEVWVIILAMISLHAFRMLATKFIVWLFALRNVFSIWLESYKWINYMQGVLFLPLAILVTYRPNECLEVTSYLAFIIFILSEILLVFRMFVVFCEDLWRFLYLFLYFCALEIIPLLLILKILT